MAASSSTSRPPPLGSLSARGPPRSRGPFESIFSGSDFGGPAGPLSARASGTQHAQAKLKQDSIDSATLPVDPSEAKALKARQRAAVHQNRHREVLREREEIEQRRQENKEKQEQIRENRFQEMLENLSRDDNVRARAAEHIREHELRHGRRQVELFEKYDAEVSQRIELHVAKFMSHTPPEAPEGFRLELRKDDCPLKVGPRAQEAEEKFHRIARSIIDSSPQTSKDTVRKRMQLEREVASRTRSRPVMPIEMWEQKNHYASPYGYFVRAIEGENELGYHSARRQGTNAHAICEKDGVSAAGKTKTKYERNQMGMLVGNVAKQGQAAGFKKDYGGGSAAPLQDHYVIEQGNTVVDAEFPLGKRAFPQMRIA